MANEIFNSLTLEQKVQVFEAFFQDVAYVLKGASLDKYAEKVLDEQKREDANNGQVVYSPECECVSLGSECDACEVES